MHEWVENWQMMHAVASGYRENAPDNIFFLVSSLVRTIQLLGLAKVDLFGCWTGLVSQKLNMSKPRFLISNEICRKPAIMCVTMGKQTFR
jgi:hypothetical protein